ncbi:hypothetical protein HU200_059820 [Digitaria exilis]|uniref:SprT-like domain-containing protein n=1 Tax=Digitaria exilis TaxID=1010633 RepID=A0A835E0U5_9POAL|nr:hypothetical protein HU200_059820 [Digitaria exilis]
MEDDVVAEADLADPNPDVEDLFQHYDRLYFQGALADAGFVVKWGSPQASRSFGSCTFSRPRNTITLSEPVLQYRSCADRKNALLHEMIHAIIHVKHHNKCHRHGPPFRAWMDAINSCSINDHQRPDGGYNITTRHDFSPEEPHSLKGSLWKCESCGDTLLRATNQGPPSDACCIENVDSAASCGNMLCHWHNHKNDCCGTYEKLMMLESDSPSQKKVPGGAQLLLTYPLEMSKSEGAIQVYSSSALQVRTTEPNAEDKHLSLVSGSNGKLPGSSSSKKAGKRRRPEVVMETSIVLAESRRKAKEKQGIAAKDDLLSLVSGTSAKSPRTRNQSKLFKAAKQHKSEDVQKPSGLPASPQGSDGSNKAGKRHKRADVQKPSVEPSAPLGTPKLHHALVATEKNKLSSAKGCNDAKSPGRNTSKKAGEQHEPQITITACSQPAYSQERLKQDTVAPEKKELPPAMCCSNEKLMDKRSSKKAHRQHESKNQRKGKLKTKPTREKEYAVMSLMLDYYESDRSSGSTEPLVNKRTERIRRERERERERARARIQTYSRSKKINSAQFVCSRTDASTSSHRIKLSPCKDELMEYWPPAPCSDAAVRTTANQVVATPATGGDHSQPSAPCLDIIPLKPADPPSLTPPDPSTTPDIIDISDDDSP